MTYAVKELFLTLQGEGAQAGRAAVFLRFAGCNLWTGREADRGTAVCTFCDTDFVGTDGVNGGKFETAAALVARAAALWSESVPPHPGPLPGGERESPRRAARAAGVPMESPRRSSVPSPLRGEGQGEGALGRRYIVCTGGEPLLQLDEALIRALKAQGFAIAIETNGTLAAPPGLDWICVSPKAEAPLVQISGDELKLVFPQADAPPARFEALDFRHFFLQPMDGPAKAENTEAAIRYCLRHPQWRLSLQTHKLLGIP